MRPVIPAFEEEALGFEAVFLPIVPTDVPFVKREGLFNVPRLVAVLFERLIVGLDMVLAPVEPRVPLRIMPFVLLIDEEDTFRPLANLLLST